FDRHLLVGIWWLGAGHYLFSLRRLSGIAYEQALAWVAPTALLLSADIAGVPAAWHGVVLLATTPIYLLVGPTRARAYAGLRRPWMRYQIAWPVYSTPYVLALLALTWPGVGPLIQLVTSLGVTALCAVSTRIFRQPLWVWMACGAGLLAGWDLALLLAPLSLTIQVIGLAGFGVLYWLVGASLERAPRYARAPLTIGYILLSLALVMAFWLAPDARPATFALVIAVSAASATLLRANRLAAICDVPLSSTVLEPSFVALAAALLPGWLAVLVPQLPGRTFDLILVSLAATYLLGVPMLGPREPAERRATFDGLLTALAVMLSGLAVAGVGRAEPLLSFGWLLAAAVFGCYLVTHPPTKQQDLPALLGGLMVLWLTMLPTARGPLQALPVIGGVAGLYVFGAGLQRRVGWLYLLGGLLCGGWLLGLHLLRVPLAEQLAWLAPAALLAVAGGLFAEQRRWPHAAVPGYLYGYALATTSVVGSLVLFTGGQLASALPQAALAMAALALLSMILALRFRAAPFIGLTGMLPVLAYLLTLSATHVPLGRYGLAAAGLSTLYLALATFPAQLASAAAQSQGMARRLADGLRLFDATLRRGFYLLSLAALLGGGLAALTSGLRPLAPICLLLAGAYGLGAYWLRRPGMVAVAAPLAAAGATALFAGYVEPLVPTAARGVLWVLLAWAFVGLARRLPSTPQAYRRPIFATGFTLASLACGWTLFDRPLLLITMGSLLLLCLRWDHTLSSAHSAPPWGNQLLARIVNMPPFLTVVALLTPIWLWLLLDTLALNRPAVAFGLALLAAAWLGVAQLVRQRPGADLPFLAACYTLVILTPIMAAEVIGWTLAIIVGLYVGIGYLASRLATAPTARFVFLVIISPLMFVLAIGALVSVGFATPSLYLTGVCGLATSIFVGSARFQRRPLWMVAAAAATPITAISGLAVIHPVESLYVILLLALGMANLGLSWL
ncbi:MAG: hypothetical protein HGA65_12420, partial [Oscillochloris sp.]|nr:hypothetical protein [Oscillochloris sp.]